LDNFAAGQDVRLNAHTAAALCEQDDSPMISAAPDRIKRVVDQTV
jgi:hypothetical protein